MKKLYSLFILISSSILFGQEYRPMLVHGNFWDQIYSEGQMYGTISSNTQLRLSNETLNYNGKEYIGIKSRIKISFIQTGEQMDWSEWSVKFYLSENIYEKKVYIYYPADFQGHEPGEYLLYDFNLEVGDTVSIEGFSNFNDELNNSDHPITVTSISSGTYYGIENVKIFNTNSGEIPYFIEGIGAYGGLESLDIAIDLHSELVDFYHDDDNYNPLLSEGNGWEVTFNQWTFGPEGMAYTDYQFRISDEILSINNKEFSGIESRHRYRTDTTPPSEWQNWSTNFYLHENIDEKKIYIYYPENTSLNHPLGEFLLYDFNLEANDMMNLEGFVNDSFINEAIVSSVSYENIYGFQEVKTYNLMAEDEFEFKVYEGLGSSTGLIHMSFMYDAGWTLTYYGILSNDEFQAKQTQIYPNPFKDKIQIQNSEDIVELHLFDLQGKLISSNKNLDELNSKLSGLNNAVYFLKITFKNNKSETIKLIKNK